MISLADVQKLDFGIWSFISLALTLHGYAQYDILPKYMSKFNFACNDFHTVLGYIIVILLVTLICS